ncbi:ferredoxin [Mycobacterium sp.]|uniref:ferredoxin n=1 Tax=Mycobacterium sp. TaxID=1785 RepID=UPI002CB2D325|nr:ferredoxin [Mycobacterium sp.]HXB86037.1 ferredoxin [Mycobacterium sp.]
MVPLKDTRNKEETAQVLVDRDACETHGACAALAPDIFEIQDNDEMVVLNDRPGIDRLPALREAVAACPRVALSIELRRSSSGDRTGEDA